MNKLTNLKLKANLIRQDLLTMLNHAGSGHTAGPLGLVEIFTALYFKILKHNPKKHLWEKRDRLILSNGHVCPVRYTTMAHAGYFPVKELTTLRKLNSRLQGHPSRVDLPALELSAASLGQGLGVSVGMALAAKLKKQKQTIYCLSSDGEHDEGSTWEAINAAAKWNLNNLINIIDRNNIQISGYTQDVWPLKSLKAKYESFGWKVYEINGHSFQQIFSTIKKAKQFNGPVCIIAFTVPGKGITFMEHEYAWHGKAPNKEELTRALLELKEERRKIK
ncbi:MAG: transketolase [Nanoarchaeota archaeon]|nr:transketolase [Nanoarchaeota archaeon]MBU1622937.1 transketolase [Nanoarchaeota archaeon]MBU1973950.1 transketolase [Nanoarchaeota archaeon]